MVFDPKICRNLLIEFFENLFIFMILSAPYGHLVFVPKFAKLIGGKSPFLFPISINGNLIS